MAVPGLNQIPASSQRLTKRFVPPPQIRSDARVTKFTSNPLLPSPLSNLPPSIKLRILHIVAQQDEHFRSRAKHYEDKDVYQDKCAVLRLQEKRYSKTLLSLALVNKEFSSLARAILFKEIKRTDKCSEPIFTLGIAHRYAQLVKTVNLSHRERRSRNYNDPPNTPDSLLSFLPLFVNLSSITFNREVLQEILPRVGANTEAQTFVARRQCIASIADRVTTLRVDAMSHKEASILDDFPRLKHLELVDLPLKPEGEKATKPGLPKLSLRSYAALHSESETPDRKEEIEKEMERKRATEVEKAKVEKEKKEIEAKAFLDAIVSKEDLEYLEVRQTRKKVVHTNRSYPPYPVSPIQPPVLPPHWILSTWPQLKCISLSGPRIGQSDLDFVAKFKDTLETLVIRQTKHQKPIADTPPLPRLPHLRSLTIETPHPTELCLFLRLSPRNDSDGDTPLIEGPLQFPLLTSLSLDGVPDSSAFEHVLSFILSHSSTLRSLDCFEPSDPFNSSSIASFLAHPSLSNCHVHTSAYPANSFPLDAFEVAQPATYDSDEDDDAVLDLREPTAEELEEMIEKALTYGEKRIEEATKLFEEDGSQVKELFALGGLYKDLDEQRAAKFA